jgi:hypothetical protein
MSIGRIIFFVIVALVLAGLVYSGVWHMFTLFIWQHPMLSWLPLLTLVAVGFAVGGVRSLTRAGGEPLRPPQPATGEAGKLSGLIGTVKHAAAKPAAKVKTDRFAFGWGFLAGLLVLLIGLWFTLISPPASGLDEIDYEVVDALPQQTQPRLLPRAGIDDDPGFRDSKEIHLVRDPATGELLWTGEWRGGWLGGPSDGIAVKSLDELVAPADIIQGGFDESVAGIRPSTLKGKAYLKHPFSRIQYPVVVPTSGDEAVAVSPYVGYKGFPFRYPYLKGVLVFHQDGELEDLSPEEAAARPELVGTGRLFPETVARSQAEALARSDEFEGEIHDGKNNSQPYLTALDDQRAVWVTIIDSKSRSEGVKAVVLADSTTGETRVWQPADGEELIASEEVLNQARALPLRWEEERCCDSEGASYTVTLREVVEARLAFKDGRPYYMVSVVPTDDLALQREIEYTLIIDAETGDKVKEFNHVAGGGAADTALQRFFR